CGLRAPETTWPTRRGSTILRPTREHRLPAGMWSTASFCPSTTPRIVSRPSTAWRASARARRASTSVSSSPRRSRRRVRPSSRGPTPSSRQAALTCLKDVGPRR
ncbi:MAG: hypothetical protein AVDCRST_MAG78-126, partial [uncultured Rubrobacteraceae bacterium]